MSSLLDVPAQLALALSLAASAAGHQPAGLAALALPAQGAQVIYLAEPLEGPYRFSERNWLRALKDDMPKEASGYAARIFKTSGSRYYVPAQDERRKILKARWNATLAQRVAAAAAKRNARLLHAALRRPPRAGDLYIAHVFGPEAAIAFIELATAKPTARVARHLPGLMTAAPALFKGDGDSLTVQQAYARLTAPLSSYEPGTHGPLPPMQAPIAQPTEPLTRQAIARTTFVPEAIDWQPQVSTARISANQ